MTITSDNTARTGNWTFSYHMCTYMSMQYSTYVWIWSLTCLTSTVKDTTNLYFLSEVLAINTGGQQWM